MMNSSDTKIFMQGNMVVYGTITVVTDYLPLDKIVPGDKLMINNGDLWVDKRGSSLKRMYTRDSRQKTLEFLKNKFIKECNKYIYINTKNYKHIVKCLLTTYSKDKKFSSQLLDFDMEIDKKLNKINDCKKSTGKKPETLFLKGDVYGNENHQYLTGPINTSINENGGAITCIGGIAVSKKVYCGGNVISNSREPIHDSLYDVKNVNTTSENGGTMTTCGGGLIQKSLYVGTDTKSTSETQGSFTY